MTRERWVRIPVVLSIFCHVVGSRVLDGVRDGCWMEGVGEVLERQLSRDRPTETSVYERRRDWRNL